MKKRYFYLMCIGNGIFWPAIGFPITTLIGTVGILFTAMLIALFYCGAKQ